MSLVVPTKPKPEVIRHWINVVCGTSSISQKLAISMRALVVYLQNYPEDWPVLTNSNLRSMTHAVATATSSMSGKTEWRQGLYNDLHWLVTAAERRGYHAFIGKSLVATWQKVVDGNHWAAKDPSLQKQALSMRDLMQQRPELLYISEVTGLAAKHPLAAIKPASAALPFQQGDLKTKSEPPKKVALPRVITGAQKILTASNSGSVKPAVTSIRKAFEGVSVPKPVAELQGRKSGGSAQVATIGGRRVLTAQEIFMLRQKRQYHCAMPFQAALFL